LGNFEPKFFLSRKTTWPHVEAAGRGDFVFRRHQGRSQDFTLKDNRS